MKNLILILSLLITHNAFSAERAAPSFDTLKVIYKAASKAGIDSQHLIRIAFVESRFKADARRVNKNGTVDVGMFQINSVHWSTTCAEFDVFTLAGNAACAAKMIKGIESKHSETDSDWLGRYHSKTPSKKRAYAERLASVELKGE